jgi:hypothetical protein
MEVCSTGQASRYLTASPGVCGLLAELADKDLAPATSHLEYVNKYMTQDPDTPNFMGRPRQELDDAWHNLLQGMNFGLRSGTLEA